MRFTIKEFLFATLISACFALLSSCSDGEKIKEEISFEFDTIPLKSKIKLALQDDYLMKLGISADEGNFLKELYKRTNFHCNWVNDSSLTENAHYLEDLLTHKLQYGIADCRRYGSKVQAHNFIQKELLYNLKLSYFLYDVKNGYLNVDSVELNPYKLSTSENLITFINAPEELTYKLDAALPKDTNYRYLLNHLREFMNAYPMDTNHFAVPTIKEDSLHSFLEAQKALKSKGYLMDLDSISTIEALKQFQKDNGLKDDAVIGKYTVKALNESTKEKIHRIILAMEKVRHRTSFPAKYILINLPEYELRFFANDSLKNKHRVVIGKVETNTPQLYSKVRKIVAFPYWNVPYSIATKEILPALKRNINYLDKHNYKVFRNGEEIDPNTVNWSKYNESNFPFKIRQEPGKSNSLGIIKFEFHNTHSVYVHDTPSKSLFSVDVRSYSHGCIRCENPGNLAKSILDYDIKKDKPNPFTSDSLDSIMNLGNHYEVPLLEPVPIYIDYISVSADKYRMVTFIDIYDRDKQYVELLMN